MAQRITRITAGPLVRVVVYPHILPHDKKLERSAKQKLTTAARQRINDGTACNTFRLLVYANFKRLDPFITLTFDDDHAPETLDDVKAVIRKLNDKVRALRRRRGQVYKYVYVIENKHGEGRWHIHMIANWCEGCAEEFESIWDLGHAHVRLLWDDLDRIARYMTKEGAKGRKVGAQMWTPSKNLVKPQRESGFVPDGYAPSLPAGAYEVVDDKPRRIDGCFCVVYILEYRTDGTAHRPFEDGDFSDCNFFQIE